MRIATIVWTVLSAACTPLAAQDIRMPANLDRLAARAEESVDVTLDRGLLQLAAKFMSDRDEDQARVKRLVSGLEGIYVRSYTFASEGEYNMADIDAFRAQLQVPLWSRIVGVKSRRHNEDVDVFLKITAGGRQLGGVVIVSAQPRELTIVNVVGTLDPDQLKDLSGEFHIPNLDTRGWRRKDMK
ncbi:MAG TPA: DUF4252 domain-containing protein [Bryobacteraceae bacterium]|nr:DUF4252 domain-containing protein [Bryobacteraceae bacterium]